ncbi:MAG: hypothetical protein QM747_05625 [Nocardioides sp.]
MPTVVDFAAVGAHTWQVPVGVTAIDVTVSGAQGGGVLLGGQGATVTAHLAVTPGETLDISVGGAGSAATGGFGGGGAGGANTTNALLSGFGGGGASSLVRDTGTATLVVAGGGGGGSPLVVAGGASGTIGGGTATGGAGGPGGPGTTGGPGSGGAAGLASLIPLCPVGSDGTAGTAGQAGVGGAGAGASGLLTSGAGGGGGGYNGGGGGGTGGSCVGATVGLNSGGGGGGSSYVIASATSPVITQGVRTGNGDVQISYVDTAPPVADPTVTPQPNANGWISGTSATVTWNWTDAGSGVNPASCTTTSTDTTQGVTTEQASCTDQNGNTGQASVDIRLDNTGPVADPQVTPQANSSGWIGADSATIAWNWSDDVSGTDPAACTTSSTDNTGGTTTEHASCTDLAGNTTQASADVKLDGDAPASGPQVTPQANGSGWIAGTSASVAWNWSDALSGIDPSSCTTTSTDTTQGATTVQASCTDQAGNTAHASTVVRLDHGKPKVKLKKLKKKYHRGAKAKASYSCTDRLSGIASCKGTVRNHGRINTRKLGKHSFKVTARDRAGNKVVKKVTYRVIR